MTLSQQPNKRASAGSTLAACWLMLALASVAATSALAADQTGLAWAPSREEAVVLGESSTAMIAEDSVLAPPRDMLRARGPLRHMPGRSRSYFTEATRAGEPLPSVAGTPMSPEGLPVPQEMYYDEAGGGFPVEGEFGPAPCDPCAPRPCGGWGGWGACAWVPLCIFVPLPPLDGLEVFGGVQGFTGPLNRGGSGSFGFHEGFNWGIPLGGLLNFQWGANWTQNNFDGNFLTTDRRNQIFFTSGFYRRVDWGLQGGLVVDYLHDEWDYSADLSQLRGELSWLWCGNNEAGFWFTAGVNDAENVALRLPVLDNANNTIRTVNGTATVGVNNIYAFFFRRQFACGGQGRLFAGSTNHSQGLVGADAQVPLSANWSLRGNFIYAAPGDNSVIDQGFAKESWNVGISLVWTPCARPACGQNYNRPLFHVADNGSFLTRLAP